MSKRKTPSEMFDMDSDVVLESTEPVLVSAAMFKVKGDDFAWRAVQIKTQGDRVISRADICTPNLRTIIEEKFKIFVAKNILGK